MPTVEEYINSVLSDRYNQYLSPAALVQKRQLTAVLTRTPKIASKDELNAVLASEVQANRVQYQQFTQEYANILNSDVRTLSQKLEAEQAAKTLKTAMTIAYFANEFGQVANATGFFATLSGSTKGASINPIASGAMSLGTSCATVISAGAMSFGAGAAIAVSAMMIMSLHAPKGE